MDVVAGGVRKKWMDLRGLIGGMDRSDGPVGMIDCWQARTKRKAENDGSAIG